MRKIFKKINKFVKNNSIIIISCLILAYMFRGCSINRLERINEINKDKFEVTIDSLYTELNFTIDTLENVRAENELLKNTIIEYRKDKDYYIDINKELINANKNLSKRPIIKLEK